MIRPEEKSDGVWDDHPNEPDHSTHRHHCASDQGREHIDHSLDMLCVNSQ